jgi:hypothetical protein
MTPNPHEQGINERMKRLVARPFCPQCHLFLEDHNNTTCEMRYEEDEPCATSALKLPPLESLCLLVGDYGSIV